MIHTNSNRQALANRKGFAIKINWELINYWEAIEQSRGRPAFIHVTEINNKLN